MRDGKRIQLQAAQQGGGREPLKASLCNDAEHSTLRQQRDAGYAIALSRFSISWHHWSGHRVARVSRGCFDVAHTTNVVAVDCEFAARLAIYTAHMDLPN